MNQRGFTLLELVVVVAILALLAAFATPHFSKLTRDAHYREAAREIASALRLARSRAVTRNLEHRVEFEPVSDRFRLMEWNVTDDDFTTVVVDWVEFPGDVVMKGLWTCDSDADFSIEFNPNGSANNRYACVMTADATPVRKFQVGVFSSTTGRVVLTK